VIAWRKGRDDPLDVEFLVVDRYDDPNGPRRGGSLEERLVRVRDVERQIRRIKFPGGIYIDSDASVEGSRSSRKAFIKQGLPEYLSATLKRVFNRQTGLTLGGAYPEPVYKTQVPKKAGDMLKCFFVSGPNTDGTDWFGDLRQELVVLGRSGKPLEILLPPRWVPHRELLRTIAYSNRAALRAAVKEIFKYEDKFFGTPTSNTESAAVDEQAVGSLP
jgi:hypothetical protein